MGWSAGNPGYASTLRYNYDALIAKLNTYVTAAAASSTYQTIASTVANYVSNTSLTTTLGNYLTTAAASATYFTSGYIQNTFMTIADAASTLVSNDGLRTQLSNFNQGIVTSGSFRGSALVVSNTGSSLLGNATFAGSVTMNSPSTINSDFQVAGTNSTLTATKINAQTFLAYNGTDINNIYASKTSGNTQTFTGNVSAPSVSATISMSAPSVSATTSISAPTINASSALQIGGVSSDTLYQQRAWIQAIIPSATVNGPVTITAQNGVATITSVNRTATGTYAIAWSPSIGSNVYLVQGNVRNSAGFVSFSGTTATACNILTYNGAGALTDIASGCHIMIFNMS